MLGKIGEISVLIVLVGHRCFCCLDFLFGGLKGITHSCGASTKDPIFLRTLGDVRKFYLQILFVSWKESNEPSCFGVVPPRSPKSYRAPIGKDRLPFPPFFRGKLAVKLRGVYLHSLDVWAKLPYRGLSLHHI